MNDARYFVQFDDLGQVLTRRRVTGVSDENSELILSDPLTFEVSEPLFDEPLLTLIDGAVTAKPSPAHDWVDGAWVLNESKQKLIDSENDEALRAAFQAELDARMNAAVAIAQPLEYANTRKKLPSDKAARLAAYNNYIDQLAELEYSGNVVWPNEPTL